PTRACCARSFPPVNREPTPEETPPPAPPWTPLPPWGPPGRAAPAPPPVVSLRPPIAREPALATTPPKAAAPSQLAVAVEKLRSADQRFREVRCDVQGGVGYLRGSVARGEDLFGLPRAVSQLPGVERR